MFGSASDISANAGRSTEGARSLGRSPHRGRPTAVPRLNGTCPSTDGSVPPGGIEPPTHGLGNDVPLRRAPNAPPQIGIQSGAIAGEQGQITRLSFVGQ